MRRTGRRTKAAAAGPATEAREALERAWREHMVRRPELGSLVTGEAARKEPFHRWIPYAQGFAPGLVRAFLGELLAGGSTIGRRPVLDPFSGSGTVVTECARLGRPAVGIEALEALAFLCSAMGAREMPPLSPYGVNEPWESIAGRLELPIHRAALMLAVGRRHTSAGKLNRGAQPLGVVLTEVEAMIREDLRSPLPLANRVLVGDARRLESIESASVAAILTSPPYLSRHDYRAIARPYETVYRWWNPRGGTRRSELGTRDSSGAGQIRAHVEAKPFEVPLADAGALAAVAEARAALEEIGESRLGRLVSAYFADLRAVLGECARALRAGGVCWMVLGGARLKGVYVPSDLIVAELAAECGLRVGELRVARNLIDVGRKLGRLANVAPRETVIVFQKR